MFTDNLMDTIVAQTTPPGVSAVAIIRLSGPNSFAIGSQIFTPSRNHQTTIQARHLYLGSIHHPDKSDKTIDHVLYTHMPKPHSYTGDDVVEIQCHGNPMVIKNIINTCIDCGARPANPGEFTERALLYGKQDLLQVEALSQLLDNSNQLLHTFFLDETIGKLGTHLRHIKKKIVSLVSLLEGSIDFPDDIEFLENDQALALCKDIEIFAQNLLTNFQALDTIKDGIRILFVGLPNAGKSTLINTIISNERLIVSDTPGTTRDYIEIPWSVDNIPVIFVDTAGIHNSLNQLEQIGIQKTHEQLDKANIVIVLAEHPDDFQQLLPSIQCKHQLHLLTKIDKAQTKANNEYFGVSSHTKAGITTFIEHLTKSIKELLPAKQKFGMITNARQKTLMEEIFFASTSAKTIISDNHDGWPLLAAEELRRIQKSLSILLGEDISEQVLEHIFSHFCVGK